MVKFYNCFFRYLLFVPLLFIAGCSASKSNFNRAYQEEWKKIIKSQAWYDALEPNDALVSVGATELYIDNPKRAFKNVDYESIIKIDNIFNDEYNSLVSRSYYKIINEAQKADERLKAEYDRLNKEKHDPINKNNQEFKNLLDLVNKKYNAHKEMLEGLKAWNIFSENRTGDLDSFKRENAQEVYRRHKNDEAEDSIIAFLVYQLADLYHFEN